MQNASLGFQLGIVLGTPVALQPPAVAAAVGQMVTAAAVPGAVADAAALAVAGPGALPCHGPAPRALPRLTCSLLL